MRLHRGKILLCALCAALAAGCVGDSTTADDSPIADDFGEPATYVGELVGSNVRIALVRGGSALEAYVCGKDSTLATHTRWFRGTTTDGGSAELALRSGAWTLRLRAAGSDMAGELESPEGVIAAWNAKRVAELLASEVGLYDVAQDGCRTGVIVWQAEPGASCQAQGSYCDGTGFRSQVTPVLCEADQPLRVRAMRDDQAIELSVARVLVP